MLFHVRKRGKSSFLMYDFLMVESTKPAVSDRFGVILVQKTHRKHHKDILANEL